MCTYLSHHILFRFFWKNYNSSRSYTKWLTCFFTLQPGTRRLMIYLEKVPYILFSGWAVWGPLLQIYFGFLLFSSLMLFMVHHSHSQFIAFNSLISFLSDRLLWKKNHVAIHGNISVRKSQLLVCGSPPRSTSTRQKRWFCPSSRLACVITEPQPLAFYHRGILSVSRASLSSEWLMCRCSAIFVERTTWHLFVYTRGYFCLLDSRIWMGIYFCNRFLEVKLKGQRKWIFLDSWRHRQTTLQKSWTE